MVSKRCFHSGTGAWFQLWRAFSFLLATLNSFSVWIGKEEKHPQNCVVFGPQEICTVCLSSAGEDSFLDGYEHKGGPWLWEVSTFDWELSFRQCVHDEEGVKKKPVQSRHISPGVGWSEGLTPQQLIFPAKCPSPNHTTPSMVNQLETPLFFPITWSPSPNRGAFLTPERMPGLKK